MGSGWSWWWRRVLTVRWVRNLPEGLWREHFLQDGEDGCESAGRDESEPFDVARVVHRHARYRCWKG